LALWISTTRISTASVLTTGIRAATRVSTGRARSAGIDVASVAAGTDPAVAGPAAIRPGARPASRAAAGHAPGATAHGRPGDAADVPRTAAAAECAAGGGRARSSGAAHDGVAGPVPGHTGRRAELADPARCGDEHHRDARRSLDGGAERQHAGQ